MPLYLHMSVHILLGLVAGAVVFYISQKFLISFFFALCGGVGVDFDHFLDYFIAFGSYFNLDHFEGSYQVLQTGKIYILLHGWEYVIIFIALAAYLKQKKAKAVFLSLALGLFFHLGADCLLNEGMKPESYSLIYRWKNDFRAERLLTPEQYQAHLIQKESTKLP